MAFRPSQVHLSGKGMADRQMFKLLSIIQASACQLIERHWISMAGEDLDDSKSDYEEGRYASSVFHAELSAQKSLKGIIVALGFEPGKTHRPSLILRNLMASGLIDLKDNLKRELDRLISLSIVLEDQGVTPWETIDRIIKPSEIYDGERRNCSWAMRSKSLK